VAAPYSNSGDIYEQAFVKMVAGFFHGISKHLFAVTRFGGRVDAMIKKKAVPDPKTDQRLHL
jgi:hypothetical protein